jgi:hypothetical protein
MRRALAALTQLAQVCGSVIEACGAPIAERQRSSKSLQTCRIAALSQRDGG